MARIFTGTVRDKSGTLASGRTVQVIRDVDNVCVGKTTTDALGEFTFPGILTESGTVTTASASVITDSAQAWTVDEFADHYGVLITSGTQAGEWRKIASNTATALTLDSALPGTTAVDDTFEVAALHTLVFNGEADRNALVFAGVMPTSDLVPWTPAEITTALWLDAADSDTITLNGSNVSQWDDKSGNAFDLTQGTSAAQPGYLENEINGLNVIQFSSAKWLGKTDRPTASAASVFFVLKHDSAETRHIIFGNRATSSLWIQAADSGSTNTSVYGSSGTPSTYYNGSLQSSLNRGTAFSTFDGAAAVASIINCSFSNSNWTTRFAVNGYSSDTWPIDKVGEIIIVGEAVDTDTRQKIEGYLAWKWGLEANLPSGHPYKDAAP